MPNLHLETTADLPENSDVPDILEALVTKLAEFESVKSESIKAFHSIRSVWHVGDGAKDGFAHLTVAVLTGRTLEWRERVAAELMDVLKVRFGSSVLAGEASVSLEVREMQSETYLKA